MNYLYKFKIKKAISIIFIFEYSTCQIIYYYYHENPDIALAL